MLSRAEIDEVLATLRLDALCFTNTNGILLIEGRPPTDEEAKKLKTGLVGLRS